TYYPSLIRYSLKDKSIKYYSHIIHELKEQLNPDARTQAQFMNAMVVEDHYLIMASAQSNIIIEFDMITEKTIYHQVGHKNNSYYHMAYDGENYWLIPHESKSIVKWNRKSK